MSPRCWPAWPIRPPSARKTEGGSPMSMQVTSQDFEANAHKAMADPNLRKAMDIIGGPMASRRVETARELPADKGTGNDPAMEWFYLGGLDNWRIAFNQDWDRAFQPPKKHFRSDNIDSQRGEAEWEIGRAPV